VQVGSLWLKLQMRNKSVVNWAPTKV